MEVENSNPITKIYLHYTHQAVSLKQGAGWYWQRPWLPGSFRLSTTDCLEKNLVYFGKLSISNSDTQTQYTLHRETETKIECVVVTYFFILYM